jgi:hypothetical protein
MGDALLAGPKVVYSVVHMVTVSAINPGKMIDTKVTIRLEVPNARCLEEECIWVNQE